MSDTEIRSVLQALSNDELNAIVVGGQAVNLWANYYCRTVPVLNLTVVRQTKRTSDRLSPLRKRGFKQLVVYLVSC
jgi:hypothetical protein